MDLSEEEVRVSRSGRSKEIADEDRYSPSATPVPADVVNANMDSAASVAAAEAAIKIVSGYRPPVAAGQTKSAPRRDPRIHPMQVSFLI